MGIVISRWKTKQSTVEVLESLEKDIQILEEFRIKNQRVLKLWVGRLLLYSSVLYLLTCVTVYLWCLPEQWTGRLVLAFPFFLFPLLVWFMRKLLIFLFSKRTERNTEKLDELRSQKKKILDEVMETETYKNAKLILERFDPDSSKQAELESGATPRPGQEVRQRSVTPRPPVMGTPSGSTSRPPLAPGATPSGPLPLAAPGGPPEKNLGSVAAQQSLMRWPASPGMQIPGPPLARPILPRERGAMDRLIEYLVGDGPQNRYALVCQQCFSHNGMALKEEFEYIAFRCGYCYVLNPARKTRPQAPRLPEFSFERSLRPEPAAAEPTSSSSSEAGEEPSDTAAPAEPGGPVAPLDPPAQEDPIAAETTGTPASDKAPSEKSDEEQEVSHMEVD